MSDNFISSKDTLERLVRLETKVGLKFSEIDKATILAREIVAKEIELAKKDLDYRLAGMNEFQKKIDKLEGTFATREALTRIERLVYIGVGIVLAIQFGLFLFLK